MRPRYARSVQFEQALTPTVTLREARLEDAASLAAAYRRNRSHLEPWDPARPPSFYEVAGQRQMLATRIAAAETGEGQPFHLVEEGEVVGGISLNQLVRGPMQKASVGYWVDRERTGRGLATAALTAVVEVAATRLRLHRLEASALPHNAASRRVLLAAGFSELGSAPSYLRIAGTWQDHVLYHRVLD
ncbi:[SSU ribosomal protein S5P]-alanine acetyltransferase [Frigoribacterium sp. PhB160]|nr:[SSU ribosomal protein S5P]-alanine acetyltransferase [Frigoribacterium sp. PhB160]